jgi:hypothetical protein
VLTDDEVLGAVLRRFLTANTRGAYGGEFFSLNEGGLVLDGHVEITDEEHAVLLRITEGDAC